MEAEARDQKLCDKQILNRFLNSNLLYKISFKKCNMLKSVNISFQPTYSNTISNKIPRKIPSQDKKKTNPM